MDLMADKDRTAIRLVAALRSVLPPMPPKDAICHIGICPQERCGNCSRIAEGYAAIAEAERGQDR